MPNITSLRKETKHLNDIANVVLKEHLLTWKKATPIPRPIRIAVSSLNHFSMSSKHPCNENTAF
jgi:hypothetical protein